MISIVTPSLNSASVIRSNLNSMMIQKTVFEHIIQDGNSSDNSVEVANEYTSKYNIRIYSEADNGLYDAIAKGFEKSNGSILGWLGADDFYTSWTLSTVENVFNQNPDVNWIIGLPAFAKEDGNLVKVNPLAPYYHQKLIRNGWYRGGRCGFIQQEAMFWRKSLWEQVDGGSLIRQYKYAGDFELWRAFAKVTNLSTVCSVFGVFAISENQVSVRHRKAYYDEIGYPERTPEPHFLCKFLNRTLSVLNSQKHIRVIQ